MIKIYHHTGCKKSRAGLQLLIDQELDFETVLYLKDQAFTFESLNSLILKTGKKPFDFIRKQEPEYKEKYKNQNLSDDEWIRIMVNSPKLIERPIIETGHHAVLMDKSFIVESLFNR